MQQLIKHTGILLFSLLFFYEGYGQTAFPSFNINSKTDLNKIVAEIGDKRIVAIGEDTHGTKEYYDLRYAITKKLMIEKGFNVFILENPYEDMVALQDSFYSKPMDSLMAKHLFAIYQTKEMKDFLVWLKEYNRTHKIKIAGCDDSYREILPALIRTELKKYNTATLNSLATDFENRQLLSIDEFYALPENKTTQALPNDIHFGYDTYIGLLKLDSLIKERNIKNEKLEVLMFQAKSNYEIYWGFMHKKFLSRDSAMGNRINYFANNKSNKVIIWANNAHIVKSSLDGEIGKMGETINKKNPGQYFSIGFATGGGTYSYLKKPFINDDHDFSDTLFQATLLPLKKNSWNEYLNSQKPVNYLIRFNSLNQQQIEFFNSKKPFRAVGYKKEVPEKTNFDTQLYPLFDLLIFLRKTNHTTPLLNKSN